jgi:NAD(P)-dependent dehydrogenase (short-subunit alcohol dehydrogenase family)
MRLLVTGAGRGIGHALVHALAARGHEVLAACRRLEPDTVGWPPSVRAIELDVTDEQSIRNAYEATTDWATVDVLVNNAGLYDMGATAYAPSRQLLGDLTQAGAVDLYALNAVGPLLVTQAWLPRLRCSKRSGGALVVNVSSLMGSITERATGGDYYYGPTKAALNWTTRTLHLDLSPDVAVVAITPGWVRTRTGGQGAERDVHDVAETLSTHLESLGSEHSGQFFDIDGSAIAW